MSLDASKLIIKQTTTPSEPIPNDKIVFGTQFSDHMLEIDWDSESGWHAPVISPYHKLELDPSAAVLHYAFELFEGLKAYKDLQGQIRLFRPNKNMERMNRSADRASLPPFDSDELLKLIYKLLLVDSKFVPEGKGYSLYVRPSMIGTTPSLGIVTPLHAKIFVILSPGAPLFGMNKSVSLAATTTEVRAWNKGIGSYKLGANYVGTVKPQGESAKRGHGMNLWLYGDDDLVTEVGGMNIFFVFKKAEGQFELVTPPLNGIILPGVTRDSIIQLVSNTYPDVKVIEREITIHEVASLTDLVEAFGAGTAAIVCPVNKIEFDGKDINISEQVGEITNKIRQDILDIQYGDKEYQDWSVVVK